MCAVLDWFIRCTLVRGGNSCVGVVEVMSVVARSFPGKGTCLFESQVPCNASRARALTLGVLRGVLTRHFDPLPALCHALAGLVGKAAKRTTGRVLVSYHGSRDCRVR